MRWPRVRILNTHLHARRVRLYGSTGSPAVLSGVAKKTTSGGFRRSSLRLCGSHRPPRQVAAAFTSYGVDREDRKSTRLNSSHITISYAVFCLKKKKKKI